MFYWKPFGWINRGLPVCEHVNKLEYHSTVELLLLTSCPVCCNIDVYSRLGSQMYLGVHARQCFLDEKKLARDSCPRGFVASEWDGYPRIWWNKSLAMAEFPLVCWYISVKSCKISHLLYVVNIGSRANKYWIYSSILSVPSWCVVCSSINW